MELIQPFRAVCPSQNWADAVCAPPYDVVTQEEARAYASGRPYSFLHLSRAEIDLPDGTDPYSAAVYAKAAKTWQRYLQEKILVREQAPHYYIYRITSRQHVQTGLIALASLNAYQTGKILRHELTRPQKEDDRVRQIEALNAQTGPVLLSFPADKMIAQLLEEATQTSIQCDVINHDGVRHQIWKVAKAELSSKISIAFNALSALYIADGHHRCAAAYRVAAARRSNPSSGLGAYGFLAVLFPHNEMRILDYNRVVSDLCGQTADELLQRIALSYNVHTSNAPVRPTQHGEVGVYFPKRWLHLTINPELIPKNDPVAALDVSLLSEYILSPLLKIHDPRMDQRIDFVGGSRGLTALEKLVDEGRAAVAFALPPTKMDDLIRVADSGAIMPPKSTWFDPKLADGLVSHILD